MNTPCKELIAGNPERWTRATTHPFLEGCRDGSLRTDQFNTWLVQDYLFVVGFSRLSGAVIMDAPRRHLDVLLSGCGALHGELAWFREKIADRSLNADTDPQSACHRYVDYMQSLHTLSYPARATAHWAIERAYHQAWSAILPAASPYQEFALRWGNDAFGQYVADLERQTNETLAAASPTEQRQAADTFLRIAEEEEAFWQMAFAE